MAPAPQDFRNHARYVPLYHGVTFILLVINLGVATWRLRRSPDGEALAQLGLAVALGLLFFYARLFALRVQDRIIRLELRLRTQAIAPELLPRFGELTAPQVVALRFAGDRELAELMKRTLDGGFANATDIKRAVTDWQADHWRA
jgi:hypothetical protein